jgi:hypothetical protein
MADKAKIQNALYRIAELASAAEDMQAFYRAVHEIVGELMYAENFFIALYDAERNLVNWPYYVSEADWRPPPPSEWVPFVPNSRSSSPTTASTSWCGRERSTSSA